MTVRMDEIDKNEEPTPPPEYSESVPPDILDTQDRKSKELPKKDLPMNVLIIGETQNGKSTMIRQIGVYAGVPDINIKIGFGRIDLA